MLESEPLILPAPGAGPFLLTVFFRTMNDPTIAALRGTQQFTVGDRSQIRITDGALAVETDDGFMYVYPLGVVMYATIQPLAEEEDQE